MIEGSLGWMACLCILVWVLFIVLAFNHVSNIVFVGLCLLKEVRFADEVDMHFFVNVFTSLVSCTDFIACLVYRTACLC